MPRKITRDAIDALYRGRDFSRGNTRVRAMRLHIDGELRHGHVLELHGSPIVFAMPGGVWVRSAGYETLTTKERLNGVPDVRVHQQDHVWHLNGKPWADSRRWTLVE